MRLSPGSRCLGVEGSSLSPVTGSVSATSLSAHACIPHKHTRSPNNGQCVERPTCRNGPLLAPPPTLLRGSEAIGASQLFSSMARSAAGLGGPAVWMCAPAQGAGPLGRRGGAEGPARPRTCPGTWRDLTPTELSLIYCISTAPPPGLTQNLMP